MAAREYDTWLADFSFVLGKDHLRSIRRDQQYETFSGSKLLAYVWIVVAAATGGALGGTLVSGSLWGGPWWQVPAWLVALIVASAAAYWTARVLFGPPIDFMAGWSLFWGLLIAVVAMWAAQLDGAGWAYGIAGGFGFLVGITQGVYQPDDLKGHDGFFALSMIGAPAGACLVVWLYRHGMLQSDLRSVALAGTLAALIFLAPSMAYFFSRFDNLSGLKRIASLLLHRDETAAEAFVPLKAALRLAPSDASLFDRRALAHALSGDDAAAERDWARTGELDPRSVAPLISRGWLALRRDQPNEAAAQFEHAARANSKERWGWIGLGVAKLRSDDPAAAIAALERVPEAQRRELDFTYLAQAQLALGDAKAAEQSADVAIDELDSIHGRSFIVRAEARRLLGDIDGAAKDYNMALTATDEPWIEQRALDGLEAIGRSVEDPTE
jgi:Tfp pilus assembly protein PilF